MKQVLRLMLIVGLAAMSVGMIAYSIRGVRYQVGDFQLTELEVNQYTFAEQITHDAKGNLTFTSALVNDEPKTFVQVACVDPAVTISVLQSTALTATAKKPAATKPSVKKPGSKKPAAKAPAVKTPAAKTPTAKAPASKTPAPKKPTPKKPAVGKACPT